MHSSTKTSRWSSESPLGFAAGDTNLQRYVGNSPTNYTDPTGHTEAPNPSLSPTDDVASQILEGVGGIRRGDWGARLPSQPLDPDDDFETVVLHHAGNGVHKSPNEIQELHMDERGWDDIGYHYVIDHEGRIYEGRPITAKGSHVGGANTGKIGILLLSDFQRGPWYDFNGDDTPTKKQLEAVSDLISELKKYFPLKMLGGHRDFKKSTECPGNIFYPLIDSIAEETELERAPANPFRKQPTRPFIDLPGPDFIGEDGIIRQGPGFKQ